MRELKERIGISAEIPKYRMIRSLEIRNFRCFKHVTLSDLARVNLVVGRNGSGKTALLESVFLTAGGSPEVVLRLRHFRGYPAEMQVKSNEADEIWDNLFYGFDQKVGIRIELRGTENDSRMLEIARGENGQSFLPLDGEGGDMRIVGPTFHWSGPGVDHKVVPAISGNKLVISEAPTTIKGVFIPAQFTLNAVETAARLSDLRKEGRHELFLKTLREIFPEIVDLSPEITPNGWMVHLRLSTSKKVVPAVLHSAGIARLIAILLAIAKSERGVTLIDEIENGLHHTVHDKVWGAIRLFANEYETTVFASTHSRECLQAALPEVDAKPDQFGLLRCQEGGEVEQFNGAQLGAALSSEFEIRE